MYYNYGPLEEGQLYSVQLFLTSLIVGFLTSFKYGLLVFVLLVIFSFIPILSSVVRFLFVGLYAFIGYMIGLNDTIFFMIFYIFVGLGVGYLINFLDYESFGS